MTRLVKLLPLVVAVLLALAPVTHLAAQASGDASNIGGLRAYWHVFIAYSIVILMILGWVISIGRRLKDIQDRLGK